MQLLTETEVGVLGRRAVEGSGGSLEEDRLWAVIRWAENVRFESALLETVLTGRIQINVKGPEFASWEFRDGAAAGDDNGS